MPAKKLTFNQRLIRAGLTEEKKMLTALTNMRVKTEAFDLTEKHQKMIAYFHYRMLKGLEEMVLCREDAHRLDDPNATDDEKFESFRELCIRAGIKRRA
jgi:hypothetical protein